MMHGSGLTKEGQWPMSRRLPSASSVSLLTWAWAKWVRMGGALDLLQPPEPDTVIIVAEEVAKLIQESAEKLQAGIGKRKVNETWPNTHF
eukprot:9823666-Karenia_brevis.AAC.2